MGPLDRLDAKFGEEARMRRDHLAAARKKPHGIERAQRREDSSPLKSRGDGEVPIQRYRHSNGPGRDKRWEPVG